MLDFENIDYDPTCNHLFQWLNETCWETSLHHITLQLAFGRKEYTNHVGSQQVASLLVNPSWQVQSSCDLLLVIYYKVGPVTRSKWSYNYLWLCKMSNWGYNPYMLQVEWKNPTYIGHLLPFFCPSTNLHHTRALNSLIYSGQIVIFHQPRFPERRRFLLLNHHLRWKLVFSVAS